MSHPNADLVRENFARFARGEGEAGYASSGEDAVWHVLDAIRYQGDDIRDEYFTMPGTTWTTLVQNYSPEIVSYESYGDDFVVVHLKSLETHIDGPIDELGGPDGLSDPGGQDRRGRAPSRGKHATTPF